MWTENPPHRFLVVILGIHVALLVLQAIYRFNTLSVPSLSLLPVVLDDVIAMIVWLGVAPLAFSFVLLSAAVLNRTTLKCGLALIGATSVINPLGTAVAVGWTNIKLMTLIWNGIVIWILAVPMSLVFFFVPSILLHVFWRRK